MPTATRIHYEKTCAVISNTRSFLARKARYLLYREDTMPKVSVIVPVYNKEKELERCLESLVNQTLKEIEIIVIDDKNNIESYIKTNV